MIDPERCVHEIKTDVIDRRILSTCSVTGRAVLPRLKTSDWLYADQFCGSCGAHREHVRAYGHHLFCKSPS